MPIKGVPGETTIDPNTGQAVVTFHMPEGEGNITLRGEQALEKKRQYEQQSGPMSVAPAEAPPAAPMTPMGGGAEPPPPTSAVMPSGRVRPVQTETGAPTMQYPEPAGPSLADRIRMEAWQPKYVGGRPEFSPAKRGAFDPSGAPVTDPRAPGFVRQGGSVTRQAGTPMDEQYRQEQRALTAAGTEIARMTTERQMADADRDAALAKTQAAEARTQAQDAEREAQDREAIYRADEEAYQEVSQQLKEKKIDPNRLFKQRGLFGNLVSAIGVSLGAMGAALGRTPNFAMQQQQAAIARDIAAQEREIDSLGASAQNALAVMDRHYRDRSEAKIALHRLMNEAMEAERGHLVATSRNPQLQEQYAQFALQQQQQQSQLEHQMRVAAQGKTTTQEAGRWAQYQRPTAGRMVRPSAAALAEADVKAREYEERMGIRRTPEQEFQLEKERAKAGGAAAAERAKVTSEGAAKIGEKMAKAQAATESISSMAQAAGLIWDPATEQYRKPEGHDIPGAGLIGGTFVGAGSEEGRRVQQKQEEAVLHVGRFISGAEVPEQQAQRIQEAMTGWGTEAEFVDGINSVVAQIRAEENRYREAFGPEASAEFDRRQREVRAAGVRKRTAAPPPPQPRER
jgi:hypothetical protein